MRPNQNSELNIQTSRAGASGRTVMKVLTGLNTYMVFLKLQANLAGERSASGFGRDLTKGTGVDIQVRSSRRRVIEDIASVKPDCHAPRFCDSDLLLQIRIEIPIAGPINRVQSQRAQLPGRPILQNDVLSVRVR